MKHAFLRKTLLLMSGTALGQIIIFASSPLLTRLYSPEDFGVLNLYTSTLSFLLVLCSLRYEMAIPIAENEKDALHLAILSITILILFSALVTIVAIITSLLDFAQKSVLQSSYLYYIIPISVFLIGLYQILLSWYIRQSNFTLITRTKLSQSIALTVATIGLGLFQFKQVGLILGDTIGKSSGSILMLRAFLKNIKANFSTKDITKKHFIKIVKKYKNYPLITTWSSLLNVAGLYLSPALFTIFLGASAGGYFSFGHRIVGTPILLVGQAISQVYTSEFTKKKHPIIIFKKIITILTLIGLLGAVILFFFGETLFTFIFGESWRTSGTYVSILSFMYLFYTIAFPVSQTLNLLGKQLLQLTWDLCRVLFTFLLFFSVHTFSIPSLMAIKLYSIGMGAFYLIQIILIYFVLNKKQSGVNVP